MKMNQIYEIWNIPMNEDKIIIREESPPSTTSLHLPKETQTNHPQITWTEALMSRKDDLIDPPRKKEKENRTRLRTTKEKRETQKKNELFCETE